ncbi:MAG TPA: hypothetical protein VEU72_05845 [Nitrosopumilaceae archaeon]|nr:hypothetical protein [Nitrosopumilaceae archaeon]
METRLEKLQLQKYLLISLVATGFGFIIAESIGKETADLFTNLIFIPIPASVVILSGILTKRNSMTGSHGKAWLIFTIFAAMWFVAEQIWLVNELVYKEKPFPSSADFFYLLAYPFYFIFSILYIYPFKNAISKKMIVITSIIAVTILIPNLYMTFDNNSGESEFAIILGSIYPIADAIVLIPSMIGTALFFKGKVNFLWSLLLIGMIFEVVADTAFQYFSLDNSYYTGHPVDILFLWSYLLFSFGLYDHIKIFKKSHDKKNIYDNKEGLR